MTRFRKQPVVIEAQHLVGDPDDLAAVVAWCGGRAVDYEQVVVEIDTLEGVMQGRLGDWIIRGVQGEFYPCKPDIFVMTYEHEDGAPIVADAP